MLARGYTHHKLPNWDKAVNGPERYLLMMNFNTSDFFTNLADVPGDTLGDTSMGGRTMYAYLASLPFVDAANMGVTGHSMGTWSSWSVAASNPDIKAVVLQCGELFPKSYCGSADNPFQQRAPHSGALRRIPRTSSTTRSPCRTILSTRNFATRSSPCRIRPSLGTRPTAPLPTAPRGVWSSLQTRTTGL